MTPISLHPQLPLPVTLDAQATFENFSVGGNAGVLAALRGDAPVVWLCGNRGLGKSHLLQALCASTDSAAYLTGPVVADWPPGSLDGFERYAVLCVDEVDRVLGEREREEALFHLYHRAQDTGCRLVLAAREVPQHLDFELPDLASRLRAAAVLTLAALSDDELVDALGQRAARRDLELPDATARYLIRHYRRDMHSLCTLLDELDLASLAARRRLTVPFVKSLL